MEDCKMDKFIELTTEGFMKAMVEYAEKLKKAVKRGDVWRKFAIQRGKRIKGLLSYIEYKNRLLVEAQVETIEANNELQVLKAFADKEREELKAKLEALNEIDIEHSLQVDGLYAQIKMQETRADRLEAIITGMQNAMLELSNEADSSRMRADNF
jgi:hypothetical protein